MKLILNHELAQRSAEYSEHTFFHQKRVSMENSQAEYIHEHDNLFQFSRHWAYALMGTAVGAVSLIAILVYVIIKRRRKASSPLSADPPKHPSLNYPPIAIHLSPTQQQPSEFAFVTGQPIRIKAKGLLERRGSNASLTIDLNQTDCIIGSAGSPPKECSAEEYLTSAGNRMTRRQLRDCIKEIKLLQQEFLDIPLNHPCKLDLPGCSNKNRYRSIWPNDSTRVVLNEVNGDILTTYINANYIRGYDGEPKAFIGTQGPLPNTVNDFWMMCWKERTPAIVMMTKLKEKNKLKCEPYLPTREGNYGPITVTVRMTVAKNGYYVRDVTLRKDNELRTMKHFWFTGWPDHKAPTSTARQLIHLAQESEAERTQQRKNVGNDKVGPVVVHCSAGIGRTGCFIGLCICMKQLHEENMIDILGTVCQMRIDRGGMIQTPEQYEFVHHAMVSYERDLPETPTTAAMAFTSSSGSSKNSSPLAN